MAIIFCTNCGKQIPDGTKFCSHCGNPVSAPSPYNNYYRPNSPYVNGPYVSTPVSVKKKSIFTLIGFILSFAFFSPAIALTGLILCIVGISKKENKILLASLGIIIAIFSMAIGFLISNNNESFNDSNSSSTISENENFNDDTTNTTITTDKQEETPLSDIEIFANNMSESSDAVNYQTAENLYLFLQKDLLFENITFEGKNSVGNILFDISADGYSLMISIDNDGIYSVRCGSYSMYEEDNIILTRQGLDDRKIVHEAEYYIMAQEIVSNNLKSPKSAVFPTLWSDEVKMQRNGNIVAVQSYVDAMNSFGSIVRSEWLVEYMVLDLDTFSYEVLYLNIDGNKAGEYIDLD